MLRQRQGDRAGPGIRRGAGGNRGRTPEAGFLRGILGERKAGSLLPLEDQAAQAEETEQEKINFRFVLALILMRKRRLKYDATKTEDGREIWRLRVVGEGVFTEVVNPHLDEEQIEQLSSQIGQILHTDMS
jgi:hypothetical protein